MLIPMVNYHQREIHLDDGTKLGRIEVMSASDGPLCSPERSFVSDNDNASTTKALVDGANIFCGD